MYYADGTYYTEEHSVSFGDLYVPSGQSYTAFNVVANTWTDWHLIPSSRPAIAHPSIVTKFVENQGSDGMLDLTTYLTGRPVYSQRQGSLSFLIANGIESWVDIQDDMISVLHGKRLKMKLEDDPGYYYEGRFTVGNLESGASNSAITISYQLDPYKRRISSEGTTPMLWDPFNFETDYDYYTSWPGGSNIVTNNVGAGTYYIYAGDYAFQPVATWVSGTATVTFGGVTKTLSSSGSQTLGKATIGQNTLTITGNGKVTIIWRGGSL